MSRTRTRAYPQKVPFRTDVMDFHDSLSGNIYHMYGPSGVFWNGPVIEFPKEVDLMTDTIGNPTGFNSVEQYTLRSTMSSLVSWHNSSGGIGTPLFKGLPTPSTANAEERAHSFAMWTPEVSAATLSDWSIEALNSFTDQVPTTVSLPNFLYELKDMKGMIPSIDRRSLSKTASNNFLAFEFGVQPFISDIKAILALSESVQKRIKHLLSVNGKATRLSFNKDVPITEPVTYYVAMAGLGSRDVQTDQDLVFRRLSGRVQFHVGAKLFQDLQGLSDSMATLKALSASGGFNSPARAVWNAIPYSFVVDWFFHVGKLLDSLTIQPFGGEYRVSDVGYSLKSEANYYVSQVHERSAAYTYPLGTVFVKSYIRRPGYPMTSLFLTNGSLTPMQQVLALAMLNQRRR